MPPEHQDIRRRLDGSIDIDFYRRRGQMERRIVMTGLLKRFGEIVKPLAAVALIAGAFAPRPPATAPAGSRRPPASRNRTRSASITLRSSAH
jgi:hypothetical protein